MKKFLIGCLCFLPLLSYGDTIYKTTDPQGNVLFTDKPVKGAEEMDVGTVQGYTAPAVPAQAPPPTADAAAPAAKVPYDRFEMIEPALDESGKVATVWSAPGVLTISVAVNPPLQQGDTVQFLLDGAVVNESQDATSFTMNDMTPGQHTVSVQIVDTEKKVVASTPSRTVYIHRATFIPQPAVPVGGMR